MTRERPLEGSLEKVEALFREPGLYQLAQILPEKGPAGRPRGFPTYMWVAYLAMLYIWDSARRVEAEIRYPAVWRLIRRIVREVFPHDRSMWLPASPMRRYHFSYGRRYLDDPEIQRQLKELAERIGISVARETGLLDPDGPGSFTHPHADSLLHADGKVIQPLFRGKPGDTRVDKKTGEIRSVRHDPDASLHIEGDGEAAWGSQFAILGTRGRHGRVILSVEHVPPRGAGNDATVVVGMLDRLAPLLPGARCLLYDKAMRGTHIATMMRRQGILPVVPVHAKKVLKPRKARYGGRVEKQVLIEVREVPRTDGSTELLSLYAHGGTLGILRRTDVGGEIFEPLQRLRIQRVADKSGLYRWYGQYRLPEGYASRELSVRLHENQEDERRGLTRAENLRAIPPSDPDFRRLYGRRNDAESTNRELDDSQYLRRAHSVGACRQLTDLIGFSLLTNARTRARFRNRERPSAAA